jgi:hypothetical protein
MHQKTVTRQDDSLEFANVLAVMPFLVKEG